MNSTGAYAQFRGNQSKHYVASKETADVVNLAIRLGRPLLVEGEAGCGKTRLASAIAEELELAGNFVTLTVKSTSQAKDMLYRFDALRRLQDAQDPWNKQARMVYPYIHLQPLGQMLQAGQPGLVLIDEIDKADIDFPNDLLDVFDRYEFDIEELPVEENQECLDTRGFGRHVSASSNSAKPIVIITSNREKQLPEAFLRRCLYIQLDFPKDPGTLAEIVQKNLANSPDEISEELISEAVNRFCEIRDRALTLSSRKPPATSELVDWVRALHWQQRSANTVKADKLSTTDQAILFKLKQDIERYRARTEDEAGG